MTITSIFNAEVGSYGPPRKINDVDDVADDAIAGANLLIVSPFLLPMLMMLMIMLLPVLMKVDFAVMRCECCGVQLKFNQWQVVLLIVPHFAA